MDIPEDIQVISTHQIWKWPEGCKTQIKEQLSFDFTKVILKDSAGEYYRARTCQRVSKKEDVILTGLKMLRIPIDDMYPIYSEGLLRAPDDAVLSKDYYIKRPILSAYEDDESVAFYKGFMLAEIHILEILKDCTHPNVVRYFGCLVKNNRLIEGICLSRCDIDLYDLGMDDPRSIDISGCISGIRRGLEHLHSLGLAHNDIKPINIMMKRGQPVIIDFDSCAMFGAELVKGGTMGWTYALGQHSDKQNDLHGLELIENWLMERRRVLETR